MLHLFTLLELVKSKSTWQFTKNNVVNFAALIQKKNHDNMGTYSEDDEENIHHINTKKMDVIKFAENKFILVSLNGRTF